MLHTARDEIQGLDDYLCVGWLTEDCVDTVIVDLITVIVIAVTDS